MYNFWTNAIFDSNIIDIKSQQVKFLKDLLNGFSVYKNISKPKKKLNYEARDLYLKLLGAPNKNIDEILISPPRDENNKEIYIQEKILFHLREQIFKKLVNKRIIKSDSDQSDIDDYEKVLQTEQN